MARRRPVGRGAGSVPPAHTVASRAWRPWVVAATAVLILAGAWWSADRLARRARGATLPPLPALAALPEPARAVVMAAAEAARSNPDSADAVGALGVACHATLMSEEAIGFYRHAEQLDPSAWRWTYLRGLLLEERGRHDEAHAAFERVVAASPGHGLAWFRLAEMAFKAGALEEAEQAYVRARDAPAAAPFTPSGMIARRVTPLAAYARFGLARVAIERGRTDEAARALDAIIAAYPAFGPARSLRGRFGGPARDLAAVRAYVPPADPAVDAVVAASTMRDLLLKHAAVAARGGDREWREFLVRRALEFNPRDPNVLLEMAALLRTSNRATEALVYLRQHQQLVPDDHHALVEEGRCLADLGRLDEAAAVLRRATRVRDAAAEYNLGTVLDRQGLSEEARRHYERALAIDPFHARALNNLGVWFDRRGRSAEAIRLLERAIQADPENAEAYSNLGSAFIGARRLPDARRVLQIAVALAPDAPDAHNNLGIALAQSGQLREALAEFEAALRLDPTHRNARRNLERLVGR